MSVEPEPPKFLSTPSARRATGVSSSVELDTENFYPRPPRGGRLRKVRAKSIDNIFLSTPSARRATGSRASGGKMGKNFYPRPPRGGRRRRVLLVGESGLFLSTPSARRATDKRRIWAALLAISIHALREEGDVIVWITSAPISSFLSTPSARRATSRSPRPPAPPANFYPRPPRGGRRPCRRCPLP